MSWTMTYDLRDLTDVNWDTGLYHTSSPPSKEASAKPDRVVGGDDLEDDAEGEDDCQKG